MPSPKNQHTRRPRGDVNAIRPEWIRCAGVVFDIEWYHDRAEFAAKVDRDHADDEAVTATTDLHERVIRMLTTVSLDLQRENLFHEVMHAVHGVVRPEFTAMPDALDKFAHDIDWEEWFIAVMDAPLVQTLRDNPIATKWMLGGA